MAPHSLLHQSSCDRQGESHRDGWGIGYYENGQPRRIRSEKPAGEDALYRKAASSVASDVILAHVRQASAGCVALRNVHPFVHGPWLFAHNGTLHGFTQNPQRLLGLIPEHLLGCIEGETDSEHAFYFLLGQLEMAVDRTQGQAGVEITSRIMKQSIQSLASLFPGTAEEPSRFNFLLTDGKSLWASRWGHSLYWLERRGSDRTNPDRPTRASPDYRAVAVASEPTTPEPWSEVPNRTLFCIHADGAVGQTVLD